jgi:DNA-binding IclR family transcriptional regulator
MAIAEASTWRGSSHAHIAELAGISRLSPSTVFVAIKTLRKERWIYTDRVTGQAGIHVACLYRYSSFLADSQTRRHPSGIGVAGNMECPALFVPVEKR